MGDKKRTAHIVSHTHWDREWRYPIYETRLLLIDFMDELIDVLESGAYPGFLLDGQVVPVDDYLELRPEMTDRIKALVQAGKLQVGPWLLLPDEYPIDGESLVRNLLWGHRRAKELGQVFNVGYTPFGWGQTAQLPQLYAGFGMDVAMIGKRVSDQRAPHSEFLWRGPDGSELLATRFGPLGRQNFYFVVHLSSLYRRAYMSDAWKYTWGEEGIPFHRADPEQAEQDFFRIDPPAAWDPETLTPAMLEEAWQSTDPSLLDDDRLMMNGCDYTAAQPLFPQMLERLNAIDPDPDREWVHTTMPAYVDILRKKLHKAELPVVEGELRDGPAGPLTGNALATRLYLKQHNKYAQNMLIRFAEPLSILAELAGAAPRETFLREAWKMLLYSHPHDSINAVTQDKTADDVMHRLDQVVDIAQTTGNRALQELVRRIDTSSFGEEDVLLLVFNPLPYPRREIVEASIALPDTDPQNPFWPFAPEGLQLFDAEGNPAGTQWAGKEPWTYCVAELHNRAFPFNVQRHKVYFETGEIPAGGYKVFRAGTRSERDAVAHGKELAWSDSQARTRSLRTAPNVLENEFLRVELNPNGTFDLTDLWQQRTYHGLNYFADRGELGDYWTNQHPRHNETYTSLGCPARCWAEEEGPLQATLVSEVTLQLPRRGLRSEQRRSEALEPLTLTTRITLRAGEELVDVRVSFDNRHADHYLRVLFPTGLEDAQQAHTGGHFHVDARPIRPQGPTPDSVWPDMGTQPFNMFVDVSDGTTGLAFITDSLTEYEVLDNQQRTVALSLLRSVKNWICTESRAGSVYPSQNGGQCLGRHELHYGLRPHGGRWHDANVPLTAEKFNAPTRLVQTRRHDGQLPGTAASLFSLDNYALRFAALKHSEDRRTMIVRLYNPTGDTQQAALRFDADVQQAWQTTLNEERGAELAISSEGAVPVAVEPHKIATFELAFRPADG